MVTTVIIIIIIIIIIVIVIIISSSSSSSSTALQLLGQSFCLLNLFLPSSSVLDKSLPVWHF